MTKDMTQGSPLKLILAFAVPLMLGSLVKNDYMGSSFFFKKIAIHKAKY